MLMFIIFSVISNAHAQHLNLNDFLAQVQGQNQGVKAARENAEGARLSSAEGELIFTPNLLLSGDYMSDKRLTNTPSFQGRETIVNTYQAGIAKRFSFGLDTRLTYRYSKNEIIGVDTNIVRFHDYADARPQFEFTQSLWRNFLGQEFRAQAELKNAQAESKQWTQSFRERGLAAQAEQAYWALAGARDLVKVRKSSLERADHLKGIAQNRSNNELLDRVDLLQAQAAWKTKDLELQMALQTLRAAQRAFNLAREKEGDEVPEELDSLEKMDFALYALPVRAPVREDVKAAEADARVADKQAQLAAEQNRPVLEFYGTLSNNGRSNDPGDARTDAWKRDHSQDSVGIRLVAPLDVGLVKDNLAGHRKEQLAASMVYQRKLLEQDREWDDLRQRYADAVERVKLARSIEDAHKEKILYERNRWGRGRSTIFQVLTFEQDYAFAQAVKLEAQLQALNYYSQIKLFTDRSNP